MSPRHRMPPGEHDLDPLLLDPTRLAIVSLLGSVQWCEFGFVRDSVQLTDPALSKQVATLTRAELIQVHKGYVGKAPRTWLRATARGRERLARHLDALQAIAARARTTAAEQPTVQPPEGAPD
jgi:DNA-binding transcriptional ArsR family regulator